MKSEFDNRAYIDEYQRKYDELKDRETGFSGFHINLQKLRKI